ncbi:MAG: hypothetical protein JO352_01265 [Chloroflexi bacterium]|nr:hypothetical protein [Chloroflexota bacterium]MBV9597793.1 hypothetical protein [Chloroflexota bacterium]
MQPALAQQLLHTRQLSCRWFSYNHVVICSRYGSSRSAWGDAHTREALTTPRPSLATSTESAYFFTVSRARHHCRG